MSMQGILLLKQVLWGAFSKLTVITDRRTDVLKMQVIKMLLIDKRHKHRLTIFIEYQ